MSSLLSHFAVVNHYYSVGIPNGAEAVGNHKACAALHQVIECFLHQLFALAVEAACGFVKNKDGGIFQYSPCYGNPLPLPAAQFYAALAHYGLVPLRKFGNKFMCIGLFGRSLYFGIGGPGLAIGNVFADGAAKQQYILWNITDLCP
jgi:hypothetical protein